MAGGAQVVVGANVSEVQPKLDSVSKAVVNMEANSRAGFEGWVGNSNKVASATEKLEKTLKGFASEQKQQGKLARFYAGEIASVIPAADGAKGALEGMLGIVVEGVAGGVSLGLAFEAVKFTIGAVSDEFKRHEEQLKLVESAQTLVGLSALRASDYIEQLTRKETDGTKAYQAAVKALEPDIVKLYEVQKKLQDDGPGWMRWVQAIVGAGDATDAWHSKMQAVGIAIKDAQRELRATAETAQALSGGYEESPEAQARYWQLKADDAARVRESTKRTAELLAQSAVLMAEARNASFEELEQEKLRLRLIQLQNQATAARLALNMNEAAAIGKLISAEKAMADQRLRARYAGFAGGGEMFGPGTDASEALFKAESAWANEAGMFGPGNEAGARAFSENLDKINKQVSDQQELWTSLGGSISSAFSSIGNMIGGVAGSILQWMGQMITQAIQLAISLSAAGSAWTTPLGAVAIAGTVAAGLLGLISSVSARAEGGPIVAGRPYLVGERGPELVVPRGSGSVIPNDQLGGVNITINASALDANWWRSNEKHIVRTLREAARSGRA